MYILQATKLSKQRSTARPEHSPRSNVDQTFSSPELPGDRNKFRSKSRVEGSGKICLDVQSASESQLLSRENETSPNSPQLDYIPGKGDQSFSPISSDIMNCISPVQETSRKCTRVCTQRNPADAVRGTSKPEKARCNNRQTAPRKSEACSSLLLDSDEALSRQIRDIHNDARKSTRIIRDSRARLLEIQKKSVITEADVKELGERNELLLREMERFDRMTRNIQKLMGGDVQLKRSREEPQRCMDYVPGSVYEPPLHHEMKMSHPTVLLAGPRCTPGSGLGHCEPQTRSKSEIDLTRKLSESYDMQEKLAADNADLEVKRCDAAHAHEYILYKELMTKDQNLETCRAQVKRLQGELKLMSRENSLLHEKLDKNNPKGDASAVNQDTKCQQDTDSSEDNEKSNIYTEKLFSKLEDYKNSSEVLEKQLGGLEQEVHHIKMEMQQVKIASTACKASTGLPNTCFEQPPGPPVPPLARACGVCPPCPAPCNPNAPPCALLRTELLKKKEELEKERCQHREVQNKLRELEMKFEGLATHTNMLLGTKEQAFEQEVNVRSLKQCYREAREEIDELRTLMKEQNDQLQDYRVKYLQAQQLVEEQRRQMDMMDMDNTRISEQINLEIQKVKLKFQEKLQELAPIPDLLKATQMRLKDAQQAQALAEHNAEQLARELNCAREKVHILLHNSTKPPPEKSQEKSSDEKQLAMMQQRLAQVTETNVTLKTEIERLKANVIRMEESVLANERRLQEKMHECAQIGGELDRARDEAARALQRANERTETIRKCMQTTIAEMERQLAATRAQVKTAEKDREELQCRMQCQIRRLNDNFEQAQLRILGLQTQVQTLRRTVSSTSEGGEGDELQECTCKSIFE
ncbi:unnamed protein product [Spodoptera exigua]|nr:unnamed protein product [Spodoptera exigua]